MEYSQPENYEDKENYTRSDKYEYQSESPKAPFSSVKKKRPETMS